MSGRRFGVGRITLQDRPTESARATPDGAKPHTGSLARRRTPGRPGVSPSVAEGHAHRVGGEATVRRAEGPRAASAPRRDGRERDEPITFGLPASAGQEKAHRIKPFRTKRTGQNGDDPKPERGEAHGGLGLAGTQIGVGGARTARGDKAQEPRPVTRGRFGLASTTVGGRPTDDPTGYKALNHASGSSHRENGRWVRAAETPRYPRAGATPRRAKTPGAPPVQLCGVPRPGRATARAGSGTPAVKERRCMTRSNRCPTRDDRGDVVVAAGTGGKPQGRVPVPPRVPNAPDRLDG